MSNNCDDIASILLTDGTNQSQRNETALDPNSLKIHGFGMEEWMKFAWRFADHLNFYKTTDAGTPDGNWQDFFTHEDDVKEFIASLEKVDNVTPHLTLFLCFLKLLELPNNRMNDLTKRHLDHYYKEILQIEKLPATYDKVHLIFELSKVFSSELYKKGLQFNGGKDANGKLRVYELIEEFAANKATVGSVRNFYSAPNGTDNYPFVKASQMAQSVDGIGEPLPEGQSEWYPYGYDTDDSAVNGTIFSELPNAKVGFSVASDTLLLAQGNRYIELQLRLITEDSADTDPDAAPPVLPDIIPPEDFVKAISVDYTGTKKWRVLDNGLDNDDKGSLLKVSVAQSGETNPNFKTIHKVGKEHVICLFMQLPADAQATAPYDPEIHGSNYNTTKPIFRFTLDMNTEEGMKIYETIGGKIESITVKVDVQGMRDITLENDRGSMNPTKPMFPFTTTPVVGSSFSIKNDEILSKNWVNIGVKAVWKNAPADFEDHYKVYDTNFFNGLSVNSYENVVGQLLGTRTRQSGDPQRRPIIVANNLPGDKAYNYFKGRIGVRTNNKWIEQGDFGTSGTGNSIFLFDSQEGNEGVYNSRFTINSANYGINEPAGNVEKIRLKLETSFFHEMYSRLYAIAVSSTESRTILPNEPYTPFAEEIVVSYTAEDKLDFAAGVSMDEYEEYTTQYFHEHPFGQSEEHNVFKEALGFLNEEDATISNEKIQPSLLPTYDTGGVFYIGLENAEEYQTIPLLFQIAEGTEDTELTPLTESNPITWDVLCNNHWKPFDSSEIIKNEVDNFLKSGIVALKMPPEITQNNTLMPSGYTWLRAKLDDQPYNIVCKFIGIHSQVALAQFTDNDNDTSHLETGIEAGTISKLIQRASSVKSITQPYNSFGGSNVEDDTSYYRRVSERLRHKRRAVTMWDYEHMVLQEFPDIYRAKCLSHTRNNCFNKAGSVTMVVIPDTVNKNVFNIYEPRVSTAYLNEIKAFLKRYTSPHVCLDVLNPNYEAIKITTRVRFHKEFDESVYKTVLNEDITKLLAPWAFDETKEIEFGGKLQRSMLINYIENLEYIDYIASIQIAYYNEAKDKFEPVADYAAKSPLTIMVSALQHDIDIAPKVCADATTSSTQAHCEE